MTVRYEGATPEGGPPDFDSARVARVASRVELDTIELVSVNLSTSDSTIEKELGDGGWGIGAIWTFEVDDEGDGDGRLEATFGLTWSPGEALPGYEIFAEFRLRYSVVRHEDLIEDDLDQFVHWNAVFNAWPYWRELVTSLTARTSIGPVVAPVFKMPAAQAEGARQ